MTAETDITRKFWKALQDDKTFLLGLAGVQEGHARPMTANFLGDDVSQVWLFTSVETELAKALSAGAHRASGYFASKGHDLFATVSGDLVADNDRTVIDRLWNPFIAAWYERGKDDPKLLLLRFTPRAAEIWLNEHSLLTGIKLLFGADPKESYQDKVAKVRL